MMALVRVVSGTGETGIEPGAGAATGEVRPC